MIRNYFKTALRFLRRNKGFTFINIFGLALGTFCCLYILLYVTDQYSYDRHQNDAADIYRFNGIHTGQSGRYNLGISATPAGPALKQDFPEVADFTRVVPFIGVEKHVVSYKEKSIWEKDAFIVDPNFFEIFTYHADAGDLRTALVDPYTAVLLKPLAEKLFGATDPLGKTITLDDTWGRHDYKVTGVVDESLGKSHLHGNIFIGSNIASSTVKIHPGHRIPLSLLM
jgi:putative ABC transport system permease protein